MSTNTENVRKNALEAIEAKFKDTTVDESLLGFGDTFCDWRAPLAKVAIVYAAENPEDPDKTYKDAEGNDKTAEQLKAAAEEQHNPTPLKLERLQKFYSELYPKEEEAGETPTTPTENPTEGGQPTVADPSNP